MPRAWWIGLVMVGVGCTTTGSRAPTVTLAPQAASAAAPAPTSNGPKLFSELPPIDSERVVGFSKDDAYLGYSISTCDPCPNEFHFASPTKPALDFSYHYDPEHDDGSQEAEERAKKNDDMVERRLLELGAVHAKDGRTLRGPFPFPDLTFASKSTRDDVTGKVAVWFGAHVDGEEPVYPIHVELGPHPMFDEDEQFAMGDAELAYANVTRDGSDVGVVVVAGGTLWYEAAGVARMPVAEFVSRVYEETAARHRHAKEH